MAPNGVNPSGLFYAPAFAKRWRPQMEGRSVRVENDVHSAHFEIDPANPFRPPLPGGSRLVRGGGGFVFAQRPRVVAG